MKKICFVTTVSLTVKAFFIPILRYLKENTDWSLAVICDGDPELEKLLPEGVTYYPVHMERGVSLSGIGATARMAKIFAREKFDLVQYSTPNAALYGAIAAKLAGVPHRKYHLMGFRFLGFTGIKRWLFKTIEKVACSLSTDIECVSASNLKLGVEQRVFKEKKASVLFHGSTSGVDMQRFDIRQKQSWRTRLRQQFGCESHECVFGFAGRITGDKGINELLEAFRQMKAPNARLVLVGQEEETQTLDTSLLEWAKDAPNVSFHGFVDDIETYFAMMDVLVLPSYREGFGNIVIEAQAMGVPVIVSDIPGPTDAMSSGQTGLVVPVKDVVALQQAMETMASDRNKREEMGQAGYRFVRECFDQKKLCQAMLEDRRRLLEERRK